MFNAFFSASLLTPSYIMLPTHNDYSLDAFNEA